MFHREWCLFNNSWQTSCFMYPAQRADLAIYQSNRSHAFFMSLSCKFFTFFSCNYLYRKYLSKSIEKRSISQIHNFCKLSFNVDQIDWHAERHFKGLLICMYWGAVCPIWSQLDFVCTWIRHMSHVLAFTQQQRF